MALSSYTKSVNSDKYRSVTRTRLVLNDFKEIDT